MPFSFILASGSPVKIKLWITIIEPAGFLSMVECLVLPSKGSGTATSKAKADRARSVVSVRQAHPPELRNKP
jgi:hypothetical protein